MSKELIVSITPQETKAAILENDQVVEIHIERDKDHGIVGAICKGKVTKVLPGMQSAFVDIGLERDAFLYVSDFFEDTEEYDKLVSTAEEQVEKLNQFPASSSTSAGSAPATSPLEDGPTPFNNSKFADRRGRSRRSRRFRLKGKHFDGPPAIPSIAQSHEPAPPAQVTAASEPSAPLSPMPGESLAKYDLPGSEMNPSVQESISSPEESSLENPSEKDLPENALAAEVFPPLDAEERADVEAAFSAAQGETRPFLSPATAETAELPQESEDVTGVSLDSPSEEVDGLGPNSVAMELVGSSSLGPKGEAVSDEPAITPKHAIGGENQVVSAEESVSGSTDSVKSEATGSLPEGELSLERLDAAAAAEQSPDAPVRSAGESLDRAASSSPTTQAKAQFRKTPGTPKFFRRGDRRRRTGYEAREESNDVSSSRPLIADLLKEGQEILVQIAKEPLGTKGARITSHIALPGRYLVYMPTVEHVGVSRKIESDDERLRLKRIIQENRQEKFPGGFIVRTAGQGKGEEEFKSDINFLYALWAEIKTRADRKKAGSVVHRDLNLVQRILRDQLSTEFTNIRVDNETEYAAIVEFINRFQPALVSRVKLYTKDAPIFEEFGIQTEIDKALRNKVWLKSGGYLVIDQAEALVAIDVNTGKYVGKSNKLEDTIVKTNIEAAKEIARQIRLRDLGGIIVCDFIDMEDRKNRFKVTQTLEEALRTDKSPSKILQFNDFGLVAITRKRVKQSLMRALCQPCSQCSGSGMVKSAQTICYEIQGEVKKMAKTLDGNEITIRVSPEVGKALKTSEAAVIEDMEAMLKRDIVIKTDPLLHPERFDIF